MVAILESDLHFSQIALATFRATPSHIHGGRQNGFVGIEMRLANPNDHLAVRLVDVYLNRVCAGRGEELHSLTSQSVAPARPLRYWRTMTRKI